MYCCSMKVGSGTLQLWSCRFPASYTSNMASQHIGMFASVICCWCLYRECMLSDYMYAVCCYMHGIACCTLLHVWHCMLLHVACCMLVACCVLMLVAPHCCDMWVVVRGRVLYAACCVLLHVARCIVLHVACLSAFTCTMLYAVTCTVLYVPCLRAGACSMLYCAACSCNVSMLLCVATCLAL